MAKLVLAVALILVAASCSDAPSGDGGSGPSAELVAAGSSFGMCVGYCTSELTIDGDRLTLTRASWQGDQSHTTTGRLTTAGRNRLADIEAALSDAEFETKYGCPDCADAGAAWVELVLASGQQRSTYDYGGPPDVLEDADRLVRALIETLSSCTASEVAQPNDDCEPLDE